MSLLKVEEGLGRKETSPAVEPAESITYPTGHPSDEGQPQVEQQREVILARPSSFFFISNKFESLDYVKILNQLEVQKEKTQTFRSLLKEDFLRIVYFLLAGVLTAFIGVFVQFGVLKVGDWKYHYLGSYVNNHMNGSAMEVAATIFQWFLGAIIPIMIGSSLVVFIAPYAAGGGVAQCVAYLNGVRVPKVLNIKGLLVKAVATVCCVISGLAGGKEGPMMHMGAIAGGSLPSALPWQVFKSDHERRDLAAAGFGAGIAVAFGAPIGGMLLALEEGVSFWNISLMWKTYLCIVMSYFTSTILLSFILGNPGNMTSPELVTFGKISDAITHWELFELGFFAIMGVIGGLLGALIVKIHIYTTLFRRRFIQTKFRKLLESFLIACFVATIGVVSFSIVRSCSSVDILLYHNSTRHGVQMYCDTNEYSDMSVLIFQTQEGVIHAMFGKDPVHIPALFTYSITYFILVCLTMGLSISAGIFVPQVVFGAVWGRMFGTILQQWLPDAQWVVPAKYAYVGATAQLSGTVGKSFSILVIMVEAAASISFYFPLMIVVVITNLVENLFVLPIYETQMHLMGLPFLPSEPPPITSDIPTSDAMSTSPLVTLPPAPTVQRILVTLSMCGHNGLPIKDDKGKLLGLILRQQLLVLLKYKAYKYPPPQTARQMCQCLDVYLKEARKQLKLEEIRSQVEDKYFDVVLDLASYYNPYPYKVYETLPLISTYSTFRSLGLRHVVVIKDNNEPIAMVTRKDLARFHAWDTLCKKGVKKMLIKN